MSDKKKGIQEGDPIWIESILSKKEYAETSKKFPSTFTKGYEPPMFFKSEFEWRYRMGSSLSLDEIKNINSNIDYLLKKVS